MPIVTTSRPVEPQVTARQKVERAIVSKAIKSLLDADYTLAVRQGDEEELAPTASYKTVMRQLGECDDDRVMVFDRCDDSLILIGWVYLVYGNDNGETVIADYTTNLEPLLKAANEYADSLFF